VGMLGPVHSDGPLTTEHDVPFRPPDREGRDDRVAWQELPDPQLPALPGSCRS
jgi:hypothetical protein